MKRLFVLLFCLFIIVNGLQRVKYKPKVSPKKNVNPTPITENGNNVNDNVYESYTGHYLQRQYIGCPLKEGGALYARWWFGISVRIASAAVYECNIKQQLITKSMCVRMFTDVSALDFTKNMFSAIVADSKMKEEQKQRIITLFKPLNKDLKKNLELVLRFDNQKLTIQYDNVVISTLNNSNVKEFDLVMNFIKTPNDFYKTI